MILFNRVSEDKKISGYVNIKTPSYFERRYAFADKISGIYYSFVSI